MPPIDLAPERVHLGNAIRNLAVVLAMLVVFAVALQVFEDHGVRSWFRRSY